MNESDRGASPRSPGPHNVAALTSIYGGVSPQKKSKPPLSPMLPVDRTLAENRKGGFSSPPARKPKVFKNPVRAAPVESSDDSDSDDDAPKVKPPKPGSFEDSFNKLMASSSSYDEVESDSESESDDDSAAKNDKSKGEKVRSTPVKSTSNDPNAYSSSERGVSTSDDDDDDDDSSSSSESSDSEDSVSSEGSNDSSDSSSTTSDDGTSKHGGMQSQSERTDDDDLASKTTAATPVEHGNRDLVDSGYEYRDENLKSEDDSSKKASDPRPTYDNTTRTAPSQFTCDNVAPGDAEEDKVLKNKKPQESEEEEDDSPDATETQSGDDDLGEVTESQAEDEGDTDGAVVSKTREAPTKGVIDAPSAPRGMLTSESEETHPEDEEERLVSASEEESILPPGSIDGMENMEVYVDSDTENEEKSRLSHDTPFVKNGLPHDPSSSQDLEGAGMQDNQHRAIQVDGMEKASPVDETEVEDSEEDRRPRAADPEQPLTAKALDKDDHDEEVGSRGDSELSEDMDDEDEEDEKKTRRKRCMLIMCCLACIVLLAIAYIFVWIFVIHKKSNGSKPADVKQLVGELFGAVAMYQLGSAVAVSGDGLTIASGAPGYQGTSGTSVGVGQVRVMSRQGPTLSEWAQIGQLLQGDNANDVFGSSVSLSGNGAMLAVGAAKRDGLGYVRVFNLTASNQWQQASSDIVANQTFSGFGVALAVSANGLVVAVGAPNHRGSNSSIRAGEVRVYGLFDQAWRQLGEPLVGQADGDGFGSSVSLSADGRIMAIGSPGNSLVANASGLVQAFMYNIPGNFWQQMGSNIKGDQELDRLGVSVSVSSDGKTLATGMVTNDARGGMVRAYRLGSDSAWSQIGNGAAGEQPYSQWGYSVALSSDGSRVVAGAPLESTINGQQSGRVRVFEVETWKEIGMGLSGKSQGDNFGQAVSISGDGRIILAGAPNFTNTFYRPNGAQELPGAGYAQVYELP